MEIVHVVAILCMESFAADLCGKGLRGKITRDRNSRIKPSIVNQLYITYTIDENAELCHFL